MDLAESRRNAETEGTARWNKFKSTSRKVAWILFAVVALGLITYWTVSATNSDSQQASAPAPPSPAARPATATQATYAPNTSGDCPGVLSKLEPLTTEVEFNPKGCYFYARGKGTVRFAGLFFGTYDVDLESGRGSKDHMKVYSARSAGGSVLWQYILCAGAKKDLTKLDCS